MRYLLLFAITLLPAATPAKTNCEMEIKALQQASADESGPPRLRALQCLAHEQYEQQTGQPFEVATFGQTGTFTISAGSPPHLSAFTTPPFNILKATKGKKPGIYGGITKRFEEKADHVCDCSRPIIGTGPSRKYENDQYLFAFDAKAAGLNSPELVAEEMAQISKTLSSVKSMPLTLEGWANMNLKSTDTGVETLFATGTESTWNAPLVASNSIDRAYLNATQMTNSLIAAQVADKCGCIGRPVRRWGTGTGGTKYSQPFGAPSSGVRAIYNNDASGLSVYQFLGTPPASNVLGR